MKRIKILLLTLLLLLSFSACSEKELIAPPAYNDDVIGITMPTTADEHWKNGGTYLRIALEKLGYEVDLRYADNIAETQIAQIEEMTEKDCGVLVITPVSGADLAQVLAQAAEKGIKILSYDSLIMDSSDVDCYVSFDHYNVGAMQGKYIEDTLKLGERNIGYYFEIFGGSSDDKNSSLYYKGAMDILTKYIEEGKLICKSGETGIESVSVSGDIASSAEIRMSSLLSEYYVSDRINVVLAQNDDAAAGLAISLLNTGYSPSRPSRPFPLITGQDCEITAVRNIMTGRQSMSVLKDVRVLSERAAEIADSLFRGETPEFNDTESYNNNAKTVNAYLCEPVLVTLANYRDVLVDSGYYTMEEIEGR